MEICTIIAKNYVAQARVLAKSFAEHHPEGRCSVLVIDDYDGYLDPAAEPFAILTPADIDCDEFEEMALRYDVLELSTAVKPWLLAHLLDAGAPAITYLDPDIQIYSSLQPLEELAIEHGVVLTPHNTEPLPDDGKRPNQIDILLAGVYNLGYVSLGANTETDALLRWWRERLLTDCRVDPLRGYFVDQRWFDLAPGLVSDHVILREPQYNVAYWNLHSRRLEFDGMHYTVNGVPVAFFHFSGFDPETPEVLSRHQSRILVSGNSALRRVCGDYAEHLAAAGYNEAKSWPYTYHLLPSGVKFSRRLRNLYEIATERQEVEGYPFTEAGDASFMSWLAAPAPGAPMGVNRLLADLYGTRPDLQGAFPDVAGDDHGAFLRWAKEMGVVEEPILALLWSMDDPAAGSALGKSAAVTDSLARIDESTSDIDRAGVEREGAADPEPEPVAMPWGVNVVGYFRSELGVGEAARQAVSALDAAGVPIMPVRSATLPLSRQGHAFTELDHRDAQFPVNLICINADMLPDFARQAGERFFAGRYSIGMWFWEVSRFREEWQGSFDLVDEVWAPTAHVAEALAPVSPVPVVTVRIPVQMPSIVPRSRAELGVPEGFFFLFSFDYLSVFERKNPLGAVEAFSRAFATGEGPSLVLKCINAERDPINHERLVAAVGERPDIIVIDRYMSPTDKDALAATCDCYVSLHRSEGFGLTMAEAMFAGKPVIATGYSGNLDFMTDENSLLVDFDLVGIGPDAPPYPADGDWADPDIEHAAELMRLVFDDQDAAAALGVRAAQDIRRTHSAATAGELMAQRLEYVRSSSTTTNRAVTADGALTSSLAVRVRRGPGAERPSASGPVRRSARRGMLRLMRPLAAYQETINADVVSSLGLVEDRLLGLRERQIRSNAMILAKLRSQDNLIALPAVAEAQGLAIDEVKGTLTGLGRRVDHMDRAYQGEHPLETDRALYAALALLADRHDPTADRPSRSARTHALTQYELRVFSQNGEDGVLAEILARIGVGERFFVEFGVESGREGNCVYLADVAGWRGLFLDCDSVFFPQLERKYRADDRVRTVEAMVTPENVQELFADARVPPEPDVLSIDVDGCDYWIWDSIEAYRPRVLIIEYNSDLDPHRRLVQPKYLEDGWDGTAYFGASLGAMRALGEQKGYRLVHTELCGVNAFFVRDDLAEGRFVPAEDVPVRGAPNYFQRARCHPPDLDARRYLDLDSGQLVPAEPGSAEVRATGTSGGK
jgi:glycosyltransferase involved in cell wall biosynthesis